MSRNQGLQRRLQGERGAAVFIVVMVLTLLTAVGIFAVRSASLADVAAGYDREAAQTSLIAQYGTTATAAYMATPVANAIISNIKPSLNCQANVNVLAPCFIMQSSLFNDAFLTAANETVFETSSSSLNANINVKTDADFAVELTEGTRTGRPIAGTALSPVLLTVTTIAQVRPAGVCPNGQTWSAGQQVMRAMITAGNL